VHAQRLLSVVKGATVLEEYTIEEQRSVVRLFVIKITECKGYSERIISCLRWDVFVA
jgi:hypothetical protein